MRETQNFIQEHNKGPLICMVFREFFVGLKFYCMKVML
jgi:hypothetical protein